MRSLVWYTSLLTVFSWQNSVAWMTSYTRCGWGSRNRHVRVTQWERCLAWTPLSESRPSKTWVSGTQKWPNSRNMYYTAGLLEKGVRAWFGTPGLWDIAPIWLLFLLFLQKRIFLIIRHSSLGKKISGSMSVYYTKKYVSNYMTNHLMNEIKFFFLIPL